jgi:hypothetical protein
MSAPVKLTADAKLGPGTLTLGATGDLIDVSCLVNGAVIAASKDKDDDTQKLCGTWRSGNIKYTYEMSGNFDVDVASDAGLFALSQDSAGQEIPYTFTPSTAAGTSAAGTLIIDPLDFGADEFGSNLTSDFTFSLTDKPTYTYGSTAPLDEE